MFYIRIHFDYNGEPVDIYLQNGFFNEEKSAVIFHRHPYCECHYIIDGEYEFNVNGVPLTIEKNSALIINPRVFHSFRHLSSNCSRIVFQINYPGLEKFESPDYSIIHKEFSLTEKLMYEIDMFNKNHIYGILTEYLRLFFFEIIIGESNFDIKFRNDRRLQIFEIINNYYNTDLTVEMLADELHLSPRQVGRVINEYFGMSFSELLTDTRLENAKYLIDHTDRSLTDIALGTGFRSYNGFWKAFRKKYGVSPNEIPRKQIRFCPPTEK